MIVMNTLNANNGLCMLNQKSILNNTAFGNMCLKYLNSKNMILKLQNKILVFMINIPCNYDGNRSQEYPCDNH